jgi:hypothetical protein
MMAGKLRHLRFNDDVWDAFVATLKPGESPTKALEDLMLKAELAKSTESLQRAVSKVSQSHWVPSHRPIGSFPPGPLNRGS